MKFNISQEELKTICQSGLSCNDIAKLYNISAPTVRSKLKLFNLTIQRDKRKSLEFRSKMSRIVKSRYENAKYRQKISKATSKAWADGKHISTIQYIKNRWQNQEYRQQQSKIHKTLWADPTFRSKMNVIFNETYNKNSFKRKISVLSKKRWADPIFRNKMLAIKRSDAYRSKLAQARSLMPRSLSKPHNKVCTILDSLNITYKIEHSIGPWTFDIFIPSYNLLIEVQGTYWHNLPKAIRNDKAKATYIDSYFKNINLKYIWEHECLNIGSVERKIKQWLNIDHDAILINISDLNVDLVDTKIADSFLYDWHYQHHGRHGLDIGAYYQNELVAISRWAGPSRQEIATTLDVDYKKMLELTRFTTNPKFKIKNLGSWLLSKAEKYICEQKSHITHLVTFADTSYGHYGAMYKSANWTHVSTTSQDYFYTHIDGFIMHKKTLWNHARSLKMSEKDFAIQNGYIKTYSNSKLKFIKVINK